MTPAQFISKWNDATLRERQGSQEHFIDLCRLLGQPTPAEDDPHGDRYCFERGATKAGGGDGWADVWRRGCFGWEYKGPHKDLNAAYRQLTIYASNLESPPYLVVSDMARIVIHTNWTNTVSRVIELSLEDLRDPANIDLLRQVFEGSDKLKPGVSPQELTKKVAARFGELGRRLQERKTPEGEPRHNPREIAHFLNRLVFCMFAEDARLLPDGLFTRLVRATERRPDLATAQLSELFAKMRTGGFFGVDVIRWFNGGLFDEAPVLPLEGIDLKLIGDTASEHDWSQIDPAIFGTLFEEALKATRQRAALGAHYTDRAKILKIVDPVIVWPLTAEWEACLARITAHGAAVRDADARRRAVMDAAGEAMKADPHAAKAGEAARRKSLTAIAKDRDLATAAARDELEAFLTRLAAYRVLDPACGSGNFLYVALHALRDLEKRAMVDAERAAGIPQQAPRVGLNQLHGIEIEAYAAELARVTLWIGDLQWQQKNGYTAYAEPILSSLTQIENRDALLNPDGTEADWPAVDAIIGNPPFLGGKWLLRDLGQGTADKLRLAFDGRVSPRADFVAYWIEKARDCIKAGKASEAGFVTTNMIRAPANRMVMQKLVSDAVIFEAWSDEEWVLEGADVRVSMFAFRRQSSSRRLDGTAVESIQADLRSSSYLGSSVGKLLENVGVCARGFEVGGPFEIAGEVARSALLAPTNPNGLTNSRVLRPLTSGRDFAGRDRDLWLIDFDGLSENEAALFEAAFARLVLAGVDTRKENWWRYRRSGADVRLLLRSSSRVLTTVLVSKHRTFRWLDSRTSPDTRLVVIGRSDDTSFGVLSSKHHEL